MPATQIERPFRVKTELGDDMLLLDRFEGTEYVSAPFQYVVRVLSDSTNVDINSLLTKPAVMSFVLGDGSEHHVHGLINRMKLLEAGEDGQAAYEMEVVPWLWFLNLFSNCRIFQNKKVPEIVEQIFRDRGFSDFRNDTSGSYPARDYCVQYRETDFNFVSRLLEEEGIFYFFEHTETTHTLVLADAKSSFAECLQAEAKFMAAEGVFRDDDTVAAIEQEYRILPGTATLTDYDFQKPNTSLLSTLAGTQKGEVYDYPGRYKSKSEGDRYARVRLEEQEVGIETVKGRGNCMGFQSGFRFTLSEHARDACNQAYTLLLVRHQGRNPSYSGGRTPDPFEYQNWFEAIPNKVDYRPARRARKPIVEGSQTAIVVGKSGEEIWTDKYGRVTVQFYWDREGKLDENSSCWIRVAHQWAGKQWGAIYTPRIGQEVIVDFLEGDPDQPIITGRVYNADQKVPYTLPDEKTKSTLKSMSSKGGGGFNEIRFEDKKDSEQIFIHGQKDLDIRIEKDRKEWIGQDRHLIVKRDKLEKIERDVHVVINRDLLEQADRDHHLTIKGKQSVDITGPQSVSVTGNVTETFKANHSEEVTASYYVKALNVVIEASVGLTIKVGGSFVTINPSGVQIQGPMVMINSGGAALSGTPGNALSPTAPSAASEADKADPGSNSTPSGSPGGQHSMQASNISDPRQRGAQTSDTSSASTADSAPPVLAPVRNTSGPPTHNPSSEENQKKKDWIEIELKDEAGNPVPGEKYRVTLPDGSVSEGTLDDKGFARIDGIDPGSCKVTFPDRDKDAWNPA